MNPTEKFELWKVTSKSVEVYSTSTLFGNIIRNINFDEQYTNKHHGEVSVYEASIYSLDHWTREYLVK